jgi:hypothetical protein
MGGRREELNPYISPLCVPPCLITPWGWRRGAVGLGFALRKGGQCSIPSMQNFKKNHSKYHARTIVKSTVKAGNVVTFFAQNNFFSESCVCDLMLYVAIKFDNKMS